MKYDYVPKSEDQIWPDKKFVRIPSFLKISHILFVEQEKSTGNNDETYWLRKDLHKKEPSWWNMDVFIWTAMKIGCGLLHYIVDQLCHI